MTYDFEKDVENAAVNCRRSYLNKARAALSASSAVQELKELQERYDALVRDEWVNIEDKLPNTQEVNYLVLSKNYGYQIGYYAPSLKGLSPRFDIVDVIFWKPLTPPKKD